MPMKSTIRSIAFAAIAVAATSSFAAGPQVARVISATPVYVNVATPQSVCGLESRVVAAQNSGGGAVVGAALSGLLAHNIAGHDKHRDADTAGGAVLGALIGNQVGSQGQQGQVVEQQVCHTEVSNSQALAGYDVTYEYAGQQNIARMNNAPGPFINVDITVRPSAYQ